MGFLIPEQMPFHNHFLQIIFQLNINGTFFNNFKILKQFLTPAIILHIYFILKRPRHMYFYKGRYGLTNLFDISLLHLLNALPLGLEAPPIVVTCPIVSVKNVIPFRFHLLLLMDDLFYLARFNI